MEAPSASLNFPFFILKKIFDQRLNNTAVCSLIWLWVNIWDHYKHLCSEGASRAKGADAQADRTFRLILKQFAYWFSFSAHGSITTPASYSNASASRKARGDARYRCRKREALYGETNLRLETRRMQRLRIFTSVRIWDSGSSGEKLEAWRAGGGGGWGRVRDGKDIDGGDARMPAHPQLFAARMLELKSLCKLMLRLCRSVRFCKAVSWKDDKDAWQNRILR